MARLLTRPTPCSEGFWNEGKSGATVQEHCDFFCWANKVQIEDDTEKAKLRKKVLLLKTAMRACRWRLKVVADVGLLGWLWLFWLWLQLAGEVLISNGCCDDGLVLGCFVDGRCI
ncbi:hypothetical protein PIB30_062174 [Stylosanthes scabra]|uniref:Zinc finger GRF-type domain-containing protein n=1 Tax=Stylosanthes scabra TaxID=79078 RepID=A0ABU6ZJT3_9FABA|nr:hypothetical protein [Stylosanthes scabra]